MMIILAVAISEVLNCAITTLKINMRSLRLADWDGERLTKGINQYKRRLWRGNSDLSRRLLRRWSPKLLSGLVPEGEQRPASGQIIGTHDLPMLRRTTFAWRSTCKYRSRALSSLAIADRIIVSH
jgi:hypothetical protein